MPTFVRLAMISYILATGASFADQLAGSEWRPAELRGSVVGPTSAAFLQFRGAGKLSGNGSCNRIIGSYETNGDMLTIGSIATTRMACEPRIMSFESRFISVLESTATYRRRSSLTKAQGNG